MYCSTAIDGGVAAEACLDALRRIAKAARNAGLKPESLHRAPAERGNARLSTLHAVNNAVGLRLRIEPA
jgi:DNA-binding phage protein